MATDGSGKHANDAGRPTSWNDGIRVPLGKRLRTAIAASGHQLAELWPGAKWLAFTAWARELRRQPPGPSTVGEDLAALHRVALNALARDLGANCGRALRAIPLDEAREREEAPDHDARLDAERVLTRALGVATPLERRVLEALAAYEGDRAAAAAALGIKPAALRKRLQRLRRKIS
jgi:transcriptional regulator with GAF, ATPase, and Fis domain